MRHRCGFRCARLAIEVGRFRAIGRFQRLQIDFGLHEDKLRTLALLGELLLELGDPRAAVEETECREEEHRHDHQRMDADRQQHTVPPSEAAADRLVVDVTAVEVEVHQWFS